MGGGEKAGLSIDPFATEEPLSKIVVEAEPGVFVSENRGILRGRVHDDVNFSLEGAHVSLLGTNFFTKTAKDGRFSLVNVTVGTFQLRVDKSEYHSHEGEVSILAGEITEVHVLLLPLINRGGGYKPHLHDLWGDAKEFTLMDQDVDLNEPPATNAINPLVYAAYTTAYYNNMNLTHYPIPVPTAGGDETPRIIFPGTKEVQVTFHWNTADVMLDKIGLAYNSALTSSFSFMGVKSPGETWTIPINKPEMTDNGHQQWTLWAFTAYAGQKPQDLTTGGSYKPSIVDGKLHVKIVLVKGELLVDPPHEDWWGDNASRLLRNKDLKTSGGSLYYLEDEAATAVKLITLPVKEIVPPGTAKMRLVFTWAYNTAPNTVDKDWALKWRTGDQDPSNTKLSQFKTVAPVQTGENLKVYEFDVKPEETDAFYQSKTNWGWYPYVPAEENMPAQVERSVRMYTLEVTAFKDLQFEA